MIELNRRRRRGHAMYPRSIHSLTSVTYVFLATVGFTSDCRAQKHQMNERTAKQGEWRVSYESNGEGEELILFVHGWGADRSTWETQMQTLDLDIPMAAVDLIGHGKSDCPEMEYTVDKLSDSVRAVADDLGAKRVILVGHSNGVPVCRDFLHRFPAITRAMVIVDGPLKNVVPGEMARAMVSRFESPEYRKSIEQLRQFQKPNGELTAAHIDLITDAMLATPQRILLSTYRAQLQPGFWKAEKIDVPVLAVYSQNPHWAMWDEDYERFLRSNVKQLELHYLQGSHLVHIEKASEFNRLLSDFVERLGRGSEPAQTDSKVNSPE